MVDSSSAANPSFPPNKDSVLGQISARFLNSSIAELVQFLQISSFSKISDKPA